MLTTVLIIVVGCASPEPEPSAGTISPNATGTTMPQPSTTGTIVVSDRGCVVDGIERSIPAGPVALTIVNETDAFVVANMSKIREGGTYEKLEAHIAKEIRLAEAGKAGLGHPSFARPSFDLFVEAAETDTLTGEVTAGTYAIVCGRTYEEVGEVRPSGISGLYHVE